MTLYCNTNCCFSVFFCCFTVAPALYPLLLLSQLGKCILDNIPSPMPRILITFPVFINKLQSHAPINTLKDKILISILNQTLINLNVVCQNMVFAMKTFLRNNHPPNSTLKNFKQLRQTTTDKSFSKMAKLFKEKLLFYSCDKDNEMYFMIKTTAISHINAPHFIYSRQSINI